VSDRQQGYAQPAAGRTVALPQQSQEEPAHGQQRPASPDDAGLGDPGDARQPSRAGLVSVVIDAGGPGDARDRARGAGAGAGEAVAESGGRCVTRGARVRDPEEIGEGVRARTTNSRGAGPRRWGRRAAEHRL